jgi:hypothetical protein
LSADRKVGLPVAIAVATANLVDENNVGWNLAAMQIKTAKKLAPLGLNG